MYHFGHFRLTADSPFSTPLQCLKQALPVWVGLHDSRAVSALTQIET
jgi:hypothetical protein